MKELRFRAWDGKKMIDDVIPASETSIIELFDRYEWQETEVKAVEQYTGLKDKNDKEIFIGDIVSEHNGDIIGEIIQKPSGEYCIAWIGIYAGSSILYDELSMCEVVGNIHENADLLGEDRNEKAQ